MARRRHVVVALALALALGVSGVARAAAPGNLDPSFGSGGVATVGGGSQLFGVAVQSGGARSSPRDNLQELRSSSG